MRYRAEWKFEMKHLKERRWRSMKRDWGKFQPKAIIVSSEKQNSANMGRPCCGGSCIGGNCKAVPKIADTFKFK